MSVHPRRKFLWRLAIAVALAWAASSVTVWMLIRIGAPVWMLAIFPAPLWAAIGAAYVEDHWRRTVREGV